MLTKQQIEVAARELCRMRGEDPARIVEVPQPRQKGCDVFMYPERKTVLELAVAEITHFETMLAAIQAGAAAAP